MDKCLMYIKRNKVLNALFFLAIAGLSVSAQANSQLANTIAKITPSIVGIGTYTATARPPAKLLGTGFVILNGQYVATNSHVVPESLNHETKEKLVVFAGQGRQPEYISAKLVARDKAHDLAILKLLNKTLPAMRLKRNKMSRPGEDIAFTGFPIGAILGLYPVSHRGMISALTPVVEPVAHSQQLDITMLKRLRDPYIVYQLDATAYPGNSGSPLYEPTTGDVIGVINKVCVKETKEAVLEKPSGITYAIPVKYLIKLTQNVD